MTTPAELLRRAMEARGNAQRELANLYADAENRDLTGEEQATETRLHGIISDNETRERNLINMVAADAELAEARAASGILDAEAADEVRESDGVETELRELAAGERRTATIGYEERDLTVGTNTAGGHLVPSDLFNELHRLVVEESPIVGLARVIRTAGGASLTFPRVTSYSAASLVAEGGAIGESDPAFDTVVLDAYKLAFATQISRELEQDAAFNVSGFVVEQGGAAIGRGSDTYFVTGSGSSQPEGVMNATTGKTTTAIAAVTAEELIDLQHSVLGPQRARGTFVFNDSTIAAIRKLKGSDGQFIWQPSYQAGVPSQLLGSPVVSDPNIDDMGTGNDFGIFGDFSGFYVRFAMGVEIDRSEHVGFMNDLVTYRFITRIDSAIVDTTGLRVITNA